MKERIPKDGLGHFCPEEDREEEEEEEKEEDDEEEEASDDVELMTGRDDDRNSIMRRFDLTLALLSLWL